MPPIKTYTFQHITNPNIEIDITCYSFEDAYEKLVMITKHPADFKCIAS